MSSVIVFSQENERAQEYSPFSVGEEESDIKREEEEVAVAEIVHETPLIQ